MGLEFLPIDSQMNKNKRGCVVRCFYVEQLNPSLITNTQHSSPTPITQHPSPSTNPQHPALVPITQHIKANQSPNFEITQKWGSWKNFNIHFSLSLFEVKIKFDYMWRLCTFLMILFFCFNTGRLSLRKAQLSLTHACKIQFARLFAFHNRFKRKTSGIKDYFCNVERYWEVEALWEAQRT